MFSFTAAKHVSSVNVALPWGATEEIYGSRAGCISALNVARPTGYAEPTEELNMFILGRLWQDDQGPSAYIFDVNALLTMTRFAICGATEDTSQLSQV